MAKYFPEKPQCLQ